MDLGGYHTHHLPFSGDFLFRVRVLLLLGGGQHIGGAIGSFFLVWEGVLGLSCFHSFFFGYWVMEGTDSDRGFGSLCG